MNIKLRLAFQFSLIVIGILLFFSLLAYYFSSTSQLSKFRQNLFESAKNSATLLINVAEVDSTLLKKIQQSTISRENEELAITDSAFHLIYSNNADYLNDDEIIKNSPEGDINFFTISDKDGVSFIHQYGNRTFYVFAMAHDKSRIENLAELRKILLWSILFSVWLSILLSYIFANRAIRPITRIIKSVKEINSLKLGNRLDEGNKKDEIAQLSITFNEMLSDLEVAFKNQEDFVSNASHELRTPLTVMISESDYILSHENDNENYVKHIAKINSDLKKVNSLVNNLLELAQINKNKRIPLSAVPIDEVVFNSIFQVKSRYHGRKIIPKILYPENESVLYVEGNEGLLKIAFKNLLENACKFSEEEVSVDFSISDDHINVSISDKGIGIPADEIENIFKPFSRATNAKFIGGFGIGLALVSIIFELHKAPVSVKSRVNKGTTIEIVFNRISI